MEERLTELIGNLTSLTKRLEDITTAQGISDTRAAVDVNDAFDSEDKQLKKQQKQQAKLNAEEEDKLAKKKKVPRKILKNIMPINVVSFDKKALQQLQSIMVTPPQIEKEKPKKKENSALSWLLTGLGLVWKKLKAAWDLIKATVSGWTKTLSGWWKKFRKTMSGRWTKFRQWFKNFKVSNLVPQSVKKWWKGFTKSTMKRWTGIRNWFKNFKFTNLVPQSVKKWWKGFTSSTMKRWTGIKNWFKNFSPKKLIPQSIRNWWGKLKFGKRWLTVKNWFINFSPSKLIPQSIRNWWKKLDVTKRWGSIKTWFKNFTPSKLIPQSIRNWWGKLDITKRWGSIKTWFKNFTPSKLIPQSIRNWWGKLNFAKRWTGIKTWFKNYTPSKLIPQSIRNWWGKLNFTKKWGSIKTWFTNFSPSKLIPQSIRTWWSKLNFSKRWTGIKTWFTNFTPSKLIPQSIRNWWGKLNFSKRWTGIKTWFTNFSPSKLVPQSIRTWWSKLDFGKKWTNIKSWFTNFSPSKLVPQSIRTWWSKLNFTKSFDTFKKFFVDLPGKIKGIVPKPIITAFDVTVKAMKTAFKPISSMITGIGNLFGGGKKGMGIFSKISGLFSMNNPIIKTAFGFLKTAGKILGKIFFPITIIMEAFNFITAFTKGFSEGGIIGGIREGVKAVFNSIIAWPLDLLKSGVSWIAGAFGFTEVEKMLDSFSFKEIFGTMFDKLFGFIDVAIGFIKGFIDDGIERVKNFFRSEEEQKARKAAESRSKTKAAAMEQAFGKVIGTEGMKKVIARKNEFEEKEGNAIEDVAEMYQDALKLAGRTAKDASEFKEKIKKDLGDNYRSFEYWMKKNRGENWSDDIFKNLKKSSGRNAKLDEKSKTVLDDLGSTLANQRQQAKRVNATVGEITKAIEKTGVINLGDEKFNLIDMRQGRSNEKLIEEYEKLIRMRDKSQNAEYKLQLGALIESLDKVGVKSAVEKLKTKKQENEKIAKYFKDVAEAERAGKPLPEPTFKLTSEAKPVPLTEEQRLAPYETPRQAANREFQATQNRLQGILSLKLDEKNTQQTLKAAEENVSKTLKPVTTVPRMPAKEEPQGVEPNRIKQLEAEGTWDVDLPMFDTVDASGNIIKAGDSINRGAANLNRVVENGFPAPQSPYAWEYVRMAGENINNGSRQLYEQSLQYEKAARTAKIDKTKDTEILSKRLDKMVELMSETADVQKKTLTVLQEHGLVDKQGNTIVNNGGNSTTVNNITTESDIMEFRNQVLGRIKRNK